MFEKLYLARRARKNSSSAAKLSLLRDNTPFPGGHQADGCESLRAADTARHYLLSPHGKLSLLERLQAKTVISHKSIGVMKAEASYALRGIELINSFRSARTEVI